MLRLCLSALLSHWRRHPLQGISILTGLWLATALWTGVQALNDQARADYARANALLAGAAQTQLVARQGERFAQSAYVQLRRAGWPVSPVLEGRLRFAGREPVSVRLLGIEPLSLPADSSVAGQSTQGFDLLHFLTPPGQAWVAPDTLQRLGLKPGDQPTSADGQRLPPLAVQAQLAPGVMIVDIGQAQRLLQAPEQLSRLLLPNDFARTLPALPDNLRTQLQLQPAADNDDLQHLTESFHLNLSALGLLAFLVGLFIVHAAIGLALEQRRGLLRTLRACGVSLRALIGALALELGLFALIAGLAGVLSGYLLASLLLGDVAASLRGLYGAQVAGHLSLSPQWWLAGLGISLLGAALAGLNSLLRSAQLPLLALAQAQAWRQAQALWLRRQSALAIVLLLIAAACWRWGDSLPSAFALLASLLPAAALVLPALLDAALALLSRLCSTPLSQWFIADSRQQLPALALALMALLLALAASVGVGSMTEGFRQTFLGWLDQRLSAELYITPRDTRQGLAMRRWLDEQPGVEAVLPQWRLELRLQGLPVQLQGMLDHDSYRQHWPLLEQQPDAWASLASGKGLMLSEQLARRLKLHLGERLALPTTPPSPALPVVALYADYGNPRGQLLLNDELLRRLWPGATLSSLNVRLPAEHVPALKAQLQSRYRLDSTRLVDQGTLKRWSVEVFERTFAATAALNSLTLSVAGVALFISLLTLGQSRLGQLAPLWALGVTRRQLAWLSLGQTLMLAGLTVLLAMPLGILLAWCLVAVVNVQAFGWRLPLHVFPMQLAHLALLGLFTSLLAAAWPLWQLARRQPADLLRQFADER
ncbi:ABC transporter permease [Pseudomonas fontis]|uniref:FtsX-like permease family protein n=1 Tax=Pseudomonas fontis TaxID=2942633 RepID=A0ABT5NL88_9PSED|nr:FtsX-like permease family protein [Pseudomonas fontis]MDD0976635.1 FtsX-like permease family protein [Pseudomonas fontis]MDD0988983.1 FtsX-like permease family protein [Pseudomonas fontis]